MCRLKGGPLEAVKSIAHIIETWQPPEREEQNKPRIEEDISTADCELLPLAKLLVLLSLEFGPKSKRTGIKWAVKSSAYIIMTWQPPDTQQNKKEKKTKGGKRRQTNPPLLSKFGHSNTAPMHAIRSVTNPFCNDHTWPLMLQPQEGSITITMLVAHPEYGGENEESTP